MQREDVNAVCPNIKQMSKSGEQTNKSQVGEKRESRGLSVVELVKETAVVIQYC